MPAFASRVRRDASVAMDHSARSARAAKRTVHADKLPFNVFPVLDGGAYLSLPKRPIRGRLRHLPALQRRAKCVPVRRCAVQGSHTVD